jgi:hypothetical protein
MADAAYGLWPPMVLNILLFVVFAASFFHPKTKRDGGRWAPTARLWPALFTEMYGTPPAIGFCVPTVSR